MMLSCFCRENGINSKSNKEIPIFFFPKTTWHVWLICLMVFILVLAGCIYPVNELSAEMQAYVMWGYVLH